LKHITYTLINLVGNLTADLNFGIIIMVVLNNLKRTHYSF